MENLLIQLFYYFHIENLRTRNSSYSNFITLSKPKPSYPIVPKNKFHDYYFHKFQKCIQSYSIHSTVPNVSQSLRRAELKHHLPRYNYPSHTHTHTHIVQNVVDPESTQGLPAFYNATRPSLFIVHRLWVEWIIQGMEDIRWRRWHDFDR